MFRILAWMYNQPNLSSTANWTQNSIAFASKSIVGDKHSHIFISSNNTVYIASASIQGCLVWYENSNDPIKIIPQEEYTQLTGPYSLSVAANGDILINDARDDRSVKRWRLNGNHVTSVEHVMSIDSPCFQLFVDIKDNVYCSLPLSFLGEIVKTNLHDTSKASINVVQREIMGGGVFQA